METLRRASIATLLAFLATTAWSVTVTGFFEKPSLDVPHLDAGAGNFLLLVRLALALGAMIFLAAECLSARGWLRRTAIAALALSLPVIFQWSCLGIERWAPRYSQPAFDAILDDYLAHRTVTEKRVLNSIGPPLLTARVSADEVEWAYSYMPSGGFGWDKRILRLKGGVVTYGYEMDEP